MNSNEFSGLISFPVIDYSNIPTNRSHRETEYFFEVLRGLGQKNLKSLLSAIADEDLTNSLEILEDAGIPSEWGISVLFIIDCELGGGDEIG